MTHFGKVLVAGKLVALLGSLIASPASAATFDGVWQVSITSNRAACSGAAVSIAVANGEVASNNAMVTASGRVAAAGAINVTLKAGLKRAVGSGRLSGTSGSGTWRGDVCSGTWTAQRI
jgi:hypothetical protein